MENDKEIKYQKVKLRFLYVSIILVLIIISLISLFFYRNVNAWLFLSFAGTAISIVLSVIAILITLIDVAGQRQQIADISDSAKTLSESTEVLQQSIEDYQNDKNEIRQIIESALNDSIGSKLTEQTNSFVDLLDELKSKFNGDKKFEESIKDIQDKIVTSTEQKKSALDNKNFQYHYSLKNYKPIYNKIDFYTTKKIPKDKINEITEYISNENLNLKHITNKENELIIEIDESLNMYNLIKLKFRISEIIDDYTIIKF